MKTISLNDLPQYSRWPARLLGLEPFGQRVRDKADTDREYERETWGVFLDRLESEGRLDQATVELIDGWLCEPDEIFAYSHGDELFADRFQDVHARFIDLTRAYLARFSPAPALVELGSGYGMVLLKIAAHPDFAGVTIQAAEYTPSGARLTALCAANQGLDVEVGRCDFLDTPLCDLDIAPGAVLFTFFAASCVPELPDSFITQLAELKPKAVVHFEPVYEHQQGEQLIDLLRRRYIELNDYNQNLLTLVNKHQQAGHLKVVLEDANFFGDNPFFPASVIAWTPSAGSE